MFMKNPKHAVKIVSVQIHGVVREDGEADPADRFILGFKCEVRRSTTAEEFSRVELQPLIDFMGFEKMVQLRGYEFGVDSDDRETIGFRKLIARSRVAMTPLESLFDRARDFQSTFAKTDFNGLNPRSFERLFSEVFNEDGLLGPVAQLLREMSKKPPANGGTTKQ